MKITLLPPVFFAICHVGVAAPAAPSTGGVGGDLPPTIKFPASATPLAAAASPSGPPPAPAELSVPPNLQGIVTPAEFHLYITFQQQLRNDDGIRELNDKIMVHVQELQKLQLQLNALREKALAGNPEAKAIGDRIQQALSLTAKRPVVQSH